MSDSKERLIVFDTTLRDGEQSPGATLNVEEKLEIARQLSRLGVDVCEAGFPIASPGDFEAVRRIAEEIGPLVEGRASGKPMVIAGLSRANKADIQRAYDAVKVAPLHRIHTFLATSDIHLEYKLKMDREECIDQVIEAVSFAKSLCDDVEFSPEDAGRSDPDFLVQVLTEAIKAGATTLNIPDTVGYRTPEEFGGLIQYLRDNTPGADDVIWSVHCHDDLGLATANTLSAVQSGARQVEVTINGIGERAGNTSLEEVVMAIHTRPNNFDVKTDVDTTQITHTSHMVSSYTGMTVQPNKAIVGANAFAHEAGIHQHGMLQNEETYEIMRPETVGLNASKLVLGKHSGKAAFSKRIEELGYHIEGDDLRAAVDRLKRVADKKKVITDADIRTIVADELYQPPETWKLDQIQVSCGDKSIPTATVSLVDSDGNNYRDAALGTGPVDAVYQAINRIIGINSKLVEYAINAVTEGLDAQAEASIRIEPIPADDQITSVNPQTGRQIVRAYSGHGASTDIVVASARAYVSALNKMIADRDDESNAAVEL